VIISKCIDRGPMQIFQHHVIYSPERKYSCHNQNTCNHTHIKYKHNQVVCSLCSQLIFLHHVRMGSPSFFMLSPPSLGFNCLSFSLLGGPGPAPPPPSKPVPFSHVSRQRPVSMLGTLIIPLFKSGDASDVNNYGPNSLLSTFL
jgi:hypothetical protein